MTDLRQRVIDSDCCWLAGIAGTTASREIVDCH